MKRTAIILCVVAALTALPASAADHFAGPKDRCTVCGMFVAKYRNWTAVIVFRDGTKAFFDGPKDLFRYYVDMGRYTKILSHADIAEITVTDYYSTNQIPARKAFYVVGSDVLGPMGRELIPLKDRRSADAFLEDHEGAKVLTFDQITPSLLAELQ
jgi:nitrous oxide reductase accessory protein NosL